MAETNKKKPKGKAGRKKEKVKATPNYLKVKQNTKKKRPEAMDTQTISTYLSTELKPWERRSDETKKAWEAFQVFLGEGRQDTLKTGKILGKSAGLIRRWSKKYEWDIRSKAYDNEIASRAIEIAQTNYAEQLSELYTGFLNTSIELKRKADEALKMFSPTDLSPRDVQGFYKVAAELMEAFKTGTAEGAKEEVSTEEDVQIYIPDNGRNMEE